jgi:alpha-mannosidase
VNLPASMHLTLRAGEPFLRATLRLDNVARDHRLRAHFPLPFKTDRSNADGAFDVVERGLEAEGGFERALPTFPCRRWVDASGDGVGLAVLHRGTPEYELIDGSDLAITLLRSVGWLSRQDLATRSGPAGPALETPGAQVPGEHTIRLAVFPHSGDWSSGRVHEAAEAFALPLRGAGVRAHAGDLAAAAGALSIEPSGVQLSSLAAVDGRVECRLYNTSGESVATRIKIGAPLEVRSPARIDLFGKELEPLTARNGVVELELRPHEIATVRLA